MSSVTLTYSDTGLRTIQFGGKGQNFGKVMKAETQRADLIANIVGPPQHFTYDLEKIMKEVEGVVTLSVSVLL